MEQNNHFEHFILKYTPSSVLNSLFSANYTLLRILNEQTPFDKPQQMFFSADDIFGSKNQSMYEYWLDGKVEAYAELRRNLIKESRGYIPAEKECRELFAKNSTKFMQTFNNAYGTKKSISDVFDKRYIIDAAFASDLAHRAYETMEFPPEKLLLFEQYDEFMRFLTDYYAIEGSREIFDALVDDLQDRGYRSFTYNKPMNPNVMLLDWNTFVDVANFTADAYNNAKARLEEIKKLMEAYAKEYEKDPNNADYKIKQNELIQMMSQDYTEIFISGNLLEYLDEIEERFKSYNKTYEGFSTKIRDKIFNFLSNQTFQSKAPNLELNEVYMHKYELCDIFDMLHGLMNSDELYAQMIKKFPLCERKTPDLFVEKTSN